VNVTTEVLQHPPSQNELWLDYWLANELINYKDARLSVWKSWPTLKVRWQVV